LLWWKESPIVAGSLDRVLKAASKAEDSSHSAEATAVPDCPNAIKVGAFVPCPSAKRFMSLVKLQSIPQSSLPVAQSDLDLLPAKSVTPASAKLSWKALAQLQAAFSRSLELQSIMDVLLATVQQLLPGEPADEDAVNAQRLLRVMANLSDFQAATAASGYLNTVLAQRDTLLDKSSRVDKSAHKSLRVGTLSQSAIFGKFVASAAQSFAQRKKEELVDKALQDTSKPPASRGRKRPFQQSQQRWQFQSQYAKRPFQQPQNQFYKNRDPPGSPQQGGKGGTRKKQFKSQQQQKEQQQGKQSWGSHPQ
jgi:hypothetical protein